MDRPGAGRRKVVPMIDRDSGGRFAPGARANPGGRPKVPDDLKFRFKKLTPQAIDVLQNCLGSEDEKIRLEAAKHILDRAYGRPAQSTELKLEGLDTAAVHLQLLVEVGARRRARLQAGEDAVLIGEAGVTVGLEQPDRHQ